MVGLKKTVVVGVDGSSSGSSSSGGSSGGSGGSSGERWMG